MTEFIRIEHTLDAAMTYRNSAQEDMDCFFLDGIQLLPNDTAPYIQRTHNLEGIEIEDWQVFLMDLCGNQLFDLTDYFNITRVFQDISGLPQVEWSLTNVPYDASSQLVYLKIQQGFNDFMYSSPFRLTNYERDYTSRWDYRNDSDETMLSIRLGIYFRQPNSSLNVTNYNNITDGRRITQNVTKTPFERWKTKLIDKFIFEQIRDLFTYRFLYCDYQRTGLYDTYETPDIEFDENFMESTILLSRNPNDIYDPFYVAPNPPAPPTAEIVLESITPYSPNQVQYDFSYSNFPFEVETLYFGWSYDGITFDDGYILQATTPQIAEINGYTENNLYYRISDAATGAKSNILQLPQDSITINNITASPGIFLKSGNKYTIYYTVAGYTPVVVFTFEASTDGINWQKLYYNYGNQNPKETTAPSSDFEFKYFRIKDPNTGIISNTYFYEI